MMLPILISVSVAPVSYFFWASAPPEVAAKAMTAVESAAIRIICLESIISPEFYFLNLPISCWATIATCLAPCGTRKITRNRSTPNTAPDRPFEIPSAIFGTKMMKRSEERRVGKERRHRWAPHHEKNNERASGNRARLDEGGHHVVDCAGPGAGGGE